TFPTPTANYSENVYANIENKGNYKSTPNEDLTTSIVNSGTGFDISGLPLKEQVDLLKREYDPNDHSVNLTSQEVDSITNNIFNDPRGEYLNVLVELEIVPQNFIPTYEMSNTDTKKS
ncbi:MAG: hypothetical protein J6J33_01395, partial [Clostridia bacterium]|nr:hypothetical protein [Clostridia bacterium]